MEIDYDNFQVELEFRDSEATAFEVSNIFLICLRLFEQNKIKDIQFMNEKLFVIDVL